MDSRHSIVNNKQTSATNKVIDLFVCSPRSSIVLDDGNGRDQGVGQKSLGEVRAECLTIRNSIFD
jgi:hypothetical protein